MTEERNDLLPETNQASPQMDYNDLKYPLLQRGIPVPTAMGDYINALVARDTLTDEDIEAIRKEMLAMFANNEQDVPSDFHDNFERWFPRGRLGKIKQRVNQFSVATHRFVNRGERG